MELASKYNPADVEGKWYQYWLDHHLFSSKPDGREPYTIVIPPPNVTGVLHMGHMLNNTIQDILVRRARMEGELKHKEGFLQGVMKKLSNEKFVNNAPAAVLELERKKQADAESIINSLKESIAALKKS